jgi:hypothetical protein
MPCGNSLDIHRKREGRSSMTASLSGNPQAYPLIRSATPLSWVPSGQPQMAKVKLRVLNENKIEIWLEERLVNFRSSSPQEPREGGTSTNLPMYSA